MNPQIKLLAEQAEMAANKGDHVDVKIMMEKFAELIVKECAKVGDSGDPLQDGGVARMIKQHFGIKS
jgi:hypothetical protein